MATVIPKRRLCTYCRTRPSSLRRRIGELPTLRNLHTESRSSPIEDPISLPADTLPFHELQELEGDGPVLSHRISQYQLALHSPVDAIREALRGDLSARSRNNEIRLAVSRALDERDTIPNVGQALGHDQPQYKHRAAVQMPDFPVSGALLDHATFREALERVQTSVGGGRPIRRIIREQLLRCQFPREILRVLAVALQRKQIARELPMMHHSLTRAIYRSRNNVTDQEILATINAIVLRLKKAKLEVNIELLNLGLKFAARARSLQGMKRYLEEFRNRNAKVSRSVFRTVIAKFSIGIRGLGEIRNGRWRRQELLQVLLGFEGTPPEQAHHLGIHLERTDWQFLHAWITVLARCRASDQIWREWEMWLESPNRLVPRPLETPGQNFTTKIRGDYWFVEQMAYSGDAERAWKILHHVGIPFERLRPVVKLKLLEKPEYANDLNDDIRTAMLEKYSAELARIEKAFGIRWVSVGSEGDGHHVFDGDLEETLETLGMPDFTEELDHGYPWEDDQGAVDMQRELNEAQEVEQGSLQ